MSDQLRAKADAILLAVTAARPDDPLLRSAGDLAAAYLAAPAWHARPPAPGVYVRRWQGGWRLVQIDDLPAAEIGPLIGYFGPIPPDPEAGR